MLHTLSKLGIPANLLKKPDRFITRRKVGLLEDTLCAEPGPAFTAQADEVQNSW